MERTLDHEKLRKAMWHFYHSEGGRGAWTELGKVSKFHPSGLARIAKGLQNATYETWVALHRAVPDKIPPPTEKEEAPPAKQAEQVGDKKPRYRYPISERLGVIVNDFERTGDTHYIDRLCNLAEDYLEFRNVRDKVITIERQVKKCME